MCTCIAHNVMLAHTYTCSFTHQHAHRWLDSSKTLYEQDVKEHDVLYLRWKYYAIKDIDPRVRERVRERDTHRQTDRQSYQKLCMHGKIYKKFSSFVA